MGRYSQRQRRGGGPSAAAPVPPPDPAAVDFVNADGSDPEAANWFFTSEVSLNDVTAPQLRINFGADPVSPDTCSQVSPTHIQAVYVGQTFTPTLPWSIDGDPAPQLTAPGGIVFPASGNLP